MKKIIILTLLTTFLLSFSPHLANAAISEDDLTEYLLELEWEKENLEEYLASYGLTFDLFENINDLKNFLGAILTDELISQILADYEITIEELHTILAEYGETLTNIKFVDDLEFYLFDYFYGEEWYYEYLDFFASIGITEEELLRLLDHLEEVSNNNPNLVDELDALLWRILELDDFESVSEVTAEAIAELLAIFEEFTRLLEIDTEFYLVKGDDKQAISLSNLISLTTTNGYDLLIEIYNKRGEFLADILLTADLFGSDLIKEAGEAITTSTQEVTEDNSLTKTEKGGKLPDTATHSLLNVLLGCIATGAGLVLIRRRKAA
ncbi:processed acidic surface protein [Salipaludibacillus sp. LMS25]|uniref:processed acidic surface protein n=1 Tax=Salipaludibacillus sp. LMS25 TaxID=2924031 RepID=UPI0020D1621C|nr:processed acidic surface protein [Salipaludibacillus sp. LMS25]UTR14102.1 processed acidic surface protein [Salipaludibacillus sp. LMS25]